MQGSDSALFRVSFCVIRWVILLTNNTFDFSWVGLSPSRGEGDRLRAERDSGGGTRKDI